VQRRPAPLRTPFHAILAASGEAAIARIRASSAPAVAILAAASGRTHPIVAIRRGRRVMTTYIMLVNWTAQGAAKAKDSPARLDAAKKALKDMGGEFKSFFMTMGRYDMIAVYEAPDDAVAARFALQLGQQGNIRTETLKAFPEAAYREIMRSMM
jgi:uncharacterized protein with GYD domain